MAAEGESVCDTCLTPPNKRIFFRRDIYSDDNIVVYDAKTGEFFDYAELLSSTCALAHTSEEWAQVKEGMRRKRWDYKNAKSFLESLEDISIEEKCMNYKAALGSNKSELEAKPKIHKLANTNMDKAVRKHKEQERLKKEHDAWISQIAKELL